MRTKHLRNQAALISHCVMAILSPVTTGACLLRQSRSLLSPSDSWRLCQANHTLRCRTSLPMSLRMMLLNTPAVQPQT